MREQREIIIVTIKASTIKRLLVIDFLLGMGVYCGVKIISASTIIALIGSAAAAEGFKRIHI
mgnify:FL=1